MANYNVAKPYHKKFTTIDAFGEAWLACKKDKKSLAEFIGISSRELNRWLAMYPELKLAILQIEKRESDARKKALDAEDNIVDIKPGNKLTDEPINPTSPAPSQEFSINAIFKNYQNLKRRLLESEDINDAEKFKQEKAIVDSVTNLYHKFGVEGMEEIERIQTLSTSDLVQLFVTTMRELLPNPTTKDICLQLLREFTIVDEGAKISGAADA